MTKDNARKKIQKLLADAAKAVRDCQALADEHGLTFHTDGIPGASNTYVSEKAIEAAQEAETEFRNGWEPSACEWEQSDTREYEPEEEHYAAHYAGDSGWQQSYR